jgi:hypothetical protein
MCQGSDTTIDKYFGTCSEIAPRNVGAKFLATADSSTLLSRVKLVATLLWRRCLPRAPLFRTSGSVQEVVRFVHTTIGNDRKNVPGQILAIQIPHALNAQHHYFVNCLFSEGRRPETMRRLAGKRIGGAVSSHQHMHER